MPVDSLTDRIAAAEIGSVNRRECLFAAFDALLPLGRKVVLEGLRASPELNGCRAVCVILRASPELKSGAARLCDPFFS